MFETLTELYQETAMAHWQLAVECYVPVLVFDKILPERAEELEETGK